MGRDTLHQLVKASKEDRRLNRRPIGWKKSSSGQNTEQHASANKSLIPLQKPFAFSHTYQ
jgi:hypothetical protein